MKTCPNCKFLLIGAETTCRFCGHDLNGPAPEQIFSRAHTAAERRGDVTTAGPVPLAVLTGAGTVVAAADETTSSAHRSFKARLAPMAALAALLLVTATALVTTFGPKQTTEATMTGPVPRADSLPWQTFAAPDGTFAVDLPGPAVSQPTGSTTTGDGVKVMVTTTTVDLSPGLIVGMTATAYDRPVRFDDPDAALRTAFDGAMERMGATSTRVHGITDLAVGRVLDGDGRIGSVHAYARVVLGPSRLHLMLMLDGDGRVDDAGAEAIWEQMIRSFHPA